MAEFLIKAIDATHPNPMKDNRACYKIGDVVVVMPDGHEWGKEERPPKFFVVKIPGLAVEQARKYIQEDLDLSDPTGARILRRRKYRVLLDNLPNTIKKDLSRDGEITVSFDQVRNYIQNKSLGITEA